MLRTLKAACVLKATQMPGLLKGKLEERRERKPNTKATIGR